MSMPEIILLIIAIALLVASFFVIGKDKGTNVVTQEKTELTQEEKEKLMRQVNSLMEDAISNSVIEADDKMSKISNEKIMAVNDYSTQLLEKIEQNNKEVVFLYDMLCQKDDEMKVTLKKMESIKRDNKEFLEKLSALMASKSKHKDGTEKKDTVSKGTVSKTTTSDGPASKETEKSLTNEKESKNSEEGSVQEKESILQVQESILESQSEDEVASSKEVNESNQKDEILHLHKQNMSILEISKELGIGQGEVKLVIDLYAKKN